VPAAPSSVSPAAPGVGTAQVRLAIDYPNAWLETRHFGDTGAWQRGCAAPCGRLLPVDGVELRVTAPDMTPSKAFRVEPGSGAALLKVDGGSAAARAWGRGSFAVGVPVALLGMTGFALGSFDDRDGLRTAGAISLGVGAALILVALPLLVHGATDVKNEKGDPIAARRADQSL
jgi:hypothetical protein